MQTHLKKLVFILCLSLPVWISAQNIRLEGTVTSATDGLPLIGVSVQSTADRNVGTITDADGRYSLFVPGNATLTFSYLGFNAQTIPVNDRQIINVQLVEDVQEMDEVLVVGTVMKKSDLTGSVATVTAEQLSQVPTSSVVQALQGKATGVFVQTNAKPGAKSSIRVRGSNSINYGTNPIFVVDGLVIDGGFDLINPEDIDNINILKDASATAIYGSRGANGVVIVTTKKGKKGKGLITYDTWFGRKEFSKTMPMMSGKDIFDLRVDSYANAYEDKNPTRNRQTYIDRYLATTDPVRNVIFSREELQSHADSVSYNWLDQIVQKGFQQNHTVSFSGGGDTGTYFMSLNYNDEIGQLKNASYKRYSGKVNLDQNVKKWLKVGTNSTFVYTDENPVVTDNTFINALRASPLLPVSEEYWYLREGKIDNQSANNPLRDLKVTNDYFSSRLMSSNFININPIKNLNIRSTYSLDVMNVEQYTYYPTTSTQSYRDALDGQSVQTKHKWLNWQWDNSISYSYTFDDVHSLNAMIGSNMSKYTHNYNQQNASGYGNDLFGYKYSSGAPDKEKYYLGSDFSSYSLMSYLARLNYVYDSRYYITLTYRADGSSRFGPKHKWGSFPSVAVSWNMAEEAFMENAKGVVNNFRFKLGYGIAGNQNIPNYTYMTIYNPSISLGSTILRNYGLYGNPDLRWEKQKQLNAGIEAGFFKDRINLLFDVFHIQNEDLLMMRSMASTSGYSNQISNVGALQNRGVELTLNAVPVQTRDFYWDINFNISADRNKVTKLFDNMTEIYNVGGWSNNEIQREGNIFLGESLNNIYVYKFDRIVQESDMDYVNSLQLGSRIVKPGDILPLDKNGDNIINDQDRYIVGKTTPDFYGGISTNFSYKGIGLLINTKYSKGAKKISYLYETLMSSNGNASAHADLVNRWTPENTNTIIPRAYSEGGRFNLSETDWAVQDASYFRISELTLYYNLPAKWLKTIYMEKIRVYFTGNNLALFSNYKGYDPDSGDWYPSSKQYVVGLNISF